MIPEPPAILDAARVLEYAPFDAQLASGRASGMIGGIAVDLQNVSGLVIVEDLARETLFLLHCNSDWETVAAGEIADVASGKASAETSFPGVAKLWRKFRSLTPEEQAEIESTRKFLRELMESEPED
jgi:hypothetical protein